MRYNIAEITTKYDNAIQLTPNEISVLKLLEEKGHIQNNDIQFTNIGKI